MRHGLMQWREAELGIADVAARQRRMQQALAAAGLDGLLVYTNHVRSGGVTWLTGFTPYWSDGLLLLPPEGTPYFATALSKRVGNWIRTVNPTAEVAHSPQPGRLVAERLAQASAKRLGVVELERLPGGLVEEIGTAVELVDATDLFGTVRGMADRAELALVRRAETITAAAFAEIDPAAAAIGAVTGPLERTVRLAGAEECYVAVAPDVTRDGRFARLDGRAPLAPVFAVRASIAYNGVWIRHARTISRDPARNEAVAAMGRWFAALADAIEPATPLAPQIAALPPPPGLALAGWRAEAPCGTRPLKTIATTGRPDAGDSAFPYLVLDLTLEAAGTFLAIGGPAGLRRGERATGGIAA